MATLETLLDNWVKKRPYLDEISKMQKVLVRATQNSEIKVPQDITMEAFEEEYRRGIPLLKSNKFDWSIVTKEAGQMFSQLCSAVAASDLPETLRRLCETLLTYKGSPEPGERVVSGLLADDFGDLENLAKEIKVDYSLLVFLGWASLRPVLETYVSGFAAWRNDKAWRRGYCPVCGSLPSMAQLVKTGNGRERFLVCGCCETRWNYQRIGCPYCNNDEQSKLAIITIDEEEDFRIDICKVCNGYLKTYVNEGEEGIALADWSTLHLDVLGKMQGYERKGNFFYKL